MSAFLSVFILLSSFSVKANSVTFPSFPTPVEGQSSTHYIIIYDTHFNDYILIKPLEPSVISMIKVGDENVIEHNGNSIIYRWQEGMNSWNIYNYGQEGIQLNLYSTRQVLFSSFDLKFNDGTIFFKKAPIKVTFLDQMKNIQMGATMMTVVYLIPLLIPLPVFLIGFRKAWAWLSKVLRKA